MRLRDLARAVRSANSGASWLTLDIMFDDETIYKKVVKSGVITPELVARLYGIKPKQVQVLNYTPGWSYKITIPRPNISGGPDETDFDGKQQHAPLVNINIPRVTRKQPRRD